MLKYSHKILRVSGGTPTPTPAVLDHDITVKEYRGYKAGDVIPAGTNLLAIITKEFESVAPVTKYTITVTSADASMGTATGGGQFDKNATTTISATAKTGYRFTQWSDGDASNPRTITVTADKTYTAQFAADEPTPTEKFTVAITSTGNGTVTPAAGSHQYDLGTSVTVTVAPGTGAQLKTFTVDGAAQTGTTATVTSDTVKTINVVVEFEEIPVVKHTITITCGEHGSTSPAAGTHEVVDGGSLAITATPDAGYKVDSMTVDSIIEIGSDGSYTFTNVTADHTYDVTFKLIPTQEKKVYKDAYVAGARTTAASTLIPPTNDNLTPGTPETVTDAQIAEFKANGMSVTFGDGTRKYFIPVLLVPDSMPVYSSIKQSGFDVTTAWASGTITVDGQSYRMFYKTSYINSGTATYDFTF